MKQLSLLCLSVLLVFSTTGCCHWLGGGGGYGAGYPFAGGGGGCNCNGGGGQAYPAYYPPYGGAALQAPAAGGCGPGGCGVSYPSTPIYGGGSAAYPGAAPGPVAFAPMQALPTY